MLSLRIWVRNRAYTDELESKIKELTAGNNSKLELQLTEDGQLAVTCAVDVQNDYLTFSTKAIQVLADKSSEEDLDAAKKAAEEADASDDVEATTEAEDADADADAESLGDVSIADEDAENVDVDVTADADWCLHTAKVVGFRCHTGEISIPVRFLAKQRVPRLQPVLAPNGMTEPVYIVTFFTGHWIRHIFRLKLSEGPSV